jgi:hypothetical protein
MRRGLLLLSTALIAFVVVPVAAAVKPAWVPEHEFIAAPPDAPLDQCAFPVLGHIEGGEIHTTFFDKAGNVVRLLGVFPGQTSTVTNLETGKSITVSDAGSFDLRFAPDGSGTLSITGHGPIPNFITGEPGLWYLNGGRVFATGDAEGNVTSVEVKGNLVDLCTQLAP